MLWLRSHRVLTYSLFSFLAFCLLSLFGLSSSCSAVSQSFVYDSSNIPNSNQLVWQGSSGSLTDTPLIDFTPVYVEVFVSDFPYYYSYNGSNSYGALSNGQYGGANIKLLIPFNTGVKYSLDLTSLVSDSTMEVWIRFGQFRSNIVNNVGSSITYIFYDSLPEGCPEPDPCPDIPDDSQTLVDIKNAIIYIPAVMLVIYFFFIMFSWYVGVYR